MSKNLTRKGLALGAAVALGSTLFAGAPAFAAVGIDLDSNGTSGVFGQVEDRTFTFTANGNSEFPVGNASTLRVLVKNINGGTASGFEINGTALDAEYADDTPDSSNDNGNAIRLANGTDATVDTIGTTAGDTAVFGLGASTDALSSSSTSVMTSPFTFAFTDTGATSTQSHAYEVTVFADTNNNGAKDTGETASTTRTVTFYDQAALTASVTFDALTEGDAQVTGTAVINNVDMKQIAYADLAIHLTDGTGAAIGDAGANLVIPGASAEGDGAVAYNSTSKNFVFATDDVTDSSTDSLEDVLAKDTALKAVVLLDNSLGGAPSVSTTADKITTTGSAAVTTRKAGSIDVDTVDSVTVSRETAANSVSAEALLNSSYAVKAIVKDTTTPTAKVLSGAAVTATVTSVRTLATGVTLSVNGTVYSSNSKLPGYESGSTKVAKLALTTDSKGEAVVNITAAGLTAGDDITVTFYVENRSADITVSNDAANYTAYVANAVDAVLTTDGSAAKVDVLVRDQFGGKPANSKYTVSSDFVSSGQPAATASTSATESFAAVSDGAATLSILDNGTGEGDNLYDLYLNTLAANGGIDSDELFADDFIVRLVTAANLSVGKVNVTDSGADMAQNDTTKVWTKTLATGNGANGELLLSDMFANDERTSFVDAPTVTSAVGVAIAGTVTTAATATAAAQAVPGAVVTISGSGLLFRTTAQGSADVYSVGSATARVAADGSYSFQVWSNNSGEKTVTITSGSSSATVLLDEFDPAGQDTATTITMIKSQSVKAGRTLVITGTLTDKYGNPVESANTDFSAVYTGPGYEFTTAVVKTTATGTFTIRVLLGTGEVGTASVAVTYDPDGSLTSADADADRVSASQTILIGVTASVSAGKKLATSVVKNAAGATIKVVSGSKVVTKVATSDSFKVSLTKLTSGKKTVKVYVNDILVTSKKVTVRR